MQTQTTLTADQINTVREKIDLVLNKRYISDDTAEEFRKHGVLQLAFMIGAVTFEEWTATEKGAPCWRSPKTDHRCSLKIDQGWRPAADAAGVV